MINAEIHNNNNGNYLDTSYISTVSEITDRCFNKRFLIEIIGMLE